VAGGRHGSEQCLRRLVFSTTQRRFREMCWPMRVRCRARSFGPLAHQGNNREIHASRFFVNRPFQFHWRPAHGARTISGRCWTGLVSGADMRSDSDSTHDWAYGFFCSHSLEDIRTAFNRVGPWNWTLRENYIEGSYLNTRPIEGVRAKLNAYPQGFISGPDVGRCAVLIRIAPGTSTNTMFLDRTVLGLLDRIEARGIIAIEPYD